ncbi:hypothetical protein JTB14_013942 [Gonioctena quinquepunctata]|nr:hypothetical protein JTB14_013942 [Gonioctena quinquepunctata]
MKLAFFVIFAVVCIFSNTIAQLDGEEEPKLELRLRRSNRRPYLPRPTPRPNFNRGKREVGSDIYLEDDIPELRIRRSNGRPYLPRPTSRPNFNIGKRNECTANYQCNWICKSRHPSYNYNVCINGECDCS